MACSDGHDAMTPLQEGLYEEEMPKKVRATGMIAQLFRNTENFEVGGGWGIRWLGHGAATEANGHRFPALPKTAALCMQEMHAMESRVLPAATVKDKRAPGNSCCRIAPAHVGTPPAAPVTVVRWHSPSPSPRSCCRTRRCCSH